jgi:poly(A) polymerase
MDTRQAYEAVSAVVSPVYLVGGSVRDLLTGRESQDFDFTTPVEPDDVEAHIRAAGRRPYLVGRKFGTVGFRIDGRIAEITTFRSESYSEGLRWPKVEFLAELADDLSRRDFTINAMALADGDVIDLFGGQADLAAGIVRAVGSPRERFAEDPLRMLRAARFAAQLDFEVDGATAEAIPPLAERILGVARERWVAELDKLLVGPGAARALSLLETSGLLRYLLPEVHLLAASALPRATQGAGISALERTLLVVAAVPPEVTLRWAALLHDIERPFSAGANTGGQAGAGAATLSAPAAAPNHAFAAEMVERLALYLKWSNRRRGEVGKLVRDQERPESPLRSAIEKADAAMPR